jgi:hypothetical protein
MRRSGVWAALVAAPALVAGWPAFAGPPYVTDDPQPTDEGHWEIYNFAGGSHVPGSTAGEGGLDLNYGGAKDLQLTAVIPFAYDTADDGHFGMGTVELAAKYKFLHQKDGSAMPDVAFFPRVFLPTAKADLGSRHTNLLLPIWLERDFGKWSVFGGGGYVVNPGVDNRNFWTSGIVVTRQVTDRLNLGAEVTHQTADARDGRDFSGVNVGMIYKVSDHWSLLASGGPGIQNARDGGQYDFYLALKADY